MDMKLNNPVFSLELKTRMRTFKAIVGIIIYVGILLFVGSMYYAVSTEGQVYNGVDAINANQLLGTTLYTLIALLQFVLIMVITPAQTAGSISGERERQTLDLLLCTKMSSLSIVVGKLLSSLAYILLLIISSLPLFSLVFLFGGITPGDIIALFLFYIVIAMVVGSISIFFSTVFKRTVVATVVSYVTIFAWYVLTFLIAIYLVSMRYITEPFIQQMSVPFILYFNPLFGLGDIMSRQLGTSTQNMFRDMFGLRMGLSIQGTNIILSPWVVNIILMCIITAIMLIISSIRIKPVRTWKKGNR